MKPGKADHDELEKENSEPASIVERRNILKSGLATTVVFAGGTAISIISCLRALFSQADDNSEEL